MGLLDRFRKKPDPNPFIPWPPVYKSTVSPTARTDIGELTYIGQVDDLVFVRDSLGKIHVMMIGGVYKISNPLGQSSRVRLDGVRGVISGAPFQFNGTHISGDPMIGYEPRLTIHLEWDEKES